MLLPELHKVKIKEDKTGRPPTPQKVNRQDNSMQMLFVTRTEARGRAPLQVPGGSLFWWSPLQNRAIHSKHTGNV